MLLRERKIQEKLTCYFSFLLLSRLIVQEGNLTIRELHPYRFCGMAEHWHSACFQGTALYLASTEQIDDVSDLLFRGG